VLVAEDGYGVRYDGNDARDRQLGSGHVFTPLSRLADEG